MFCKNCGKELTSNDKFCDSCGTVNEGYVETPSAPVEENTFMQTQPFSIDEVAQKVEENNEAVVTPEVTPEAPVVETHIEPVVTPTVEAPVEEPTTPAIETPVAPVEPTIAPAPVIAPVESAHIAAAPKKKGGNTDAYKKHGTYAKSFYSLLSCPSCVKIYTLGRYYHRVHHEISWNNCVPKIISDRFKER